mmetsp:Transcript_64593/g.173110  ORF Transcript_64593/g.173110 Transcript_64593/m.173110 type:complete len:318 (+) Transcript_64593:2358-3311(+)
MRACCIESSRRPISLMPLVVRRSMSPNCEVSSDKAPSICFSILPSLALEPDSSRSLARVPASASPLPHRSDAAYWGDLPRRCFPYTSEPPLGNRLPHSASGTWRRRQLPPLPRRCPAGSGTDDLAEMAALWCSDEEPPPGDRTTSRLGASGLRGRVRRFNPPPRAVGVSSSGVRRLSLEVCLCLCFKIPLPLVIEALPLAHGPLPISQFDATRRGDLSVRARWRSDDPLGLLPRSGADPSMSARLLSPAPPRASFLLVLPFGLLVREMRMGPDRSTASGNSGGLLDAAGDIVLLKFSFDGVFFLCCRILPPRSVSEP